MFEKNTVKDLREIKSAYEIELTDESTFLVALAVHRIDEFNNLKKIPSCWGQPIGGYTYDEQNKFYIVRCVDSFAIGFIPVAYQLKIKNTDNWQMRVPLSEKIIKRYMTPDQKADYRKFQSTYAGVNAVTNCKIEFFQMVTKL